MAPSLVSPSARRLEAELVVVGLGGAGGVSAIEARRLGVDVLVVERAQHGFEGGSTRVSAQGYLNVTNAGAASKYLEALARGTARNTDRLAKWAAEASHNNEWLGSIGVTPQLLRATHPDAEYPEFPGANSIEKYAVRDTNGDLGLWTALMVSIRTLGIRVEYDCRAVELLRDRTGRVSGVSCVEASGSTLEVSASKGVVLASGGFAASSRHLRNFVPMLTAAATAGSPYSTGDGIDMAASVGARMMGMAAVAGPYLAYLPPGYSATVPLEPLLPSAAFNVGGFVAVDCMGSRFTDERAETRHGRVNVNAAWKYRELPARSFLVFDEALLRLGPLVSNSSRSGWTKGVAGLRWSANNLRELSSGWIMSASSTDDLASIVSCPAESLYDTIREWNSSCSMGADRRFGRASMLHPLQGPPYFVLPLVPSILNTQGGPERDANGRVIGQDGQPIDGLYSAGELGSVFTDLYQGAGNLADCLVSGRVAARAASSHGRSERVPLVSQPRIARNSQQMRSQKE